jgi:hypothetical protein
MWRCCRSVGRASRSGQPDGFLDGNSEVLESLVKPNGGPGRSTGDVEGAFRDATGELFDLQVHRHRDHRHHRPAAAGQPRLHHPRSVRHLVRVSLVDTILIRRTGTARKEAVLVGCCIASQGGSHLLHLAVRSSRT